MPADPGAQPPRAAELAEEMREARRGAGPGGGWGLSLAPSVLTWPTQTPQGLSGGGRKRKESDRYYLGAKEQLKSNRQKDSHSCLFQVLERREPTPGSPPTGPGKSHPQAPRRRKFCSPAQPISLRPREKRAVAPGPGGPQGALRRPDPRVERPQALRDPPAVKGGNGTWAATPPGLNRDVGSQGTCVAGMRCCSPGAAFLSFVATFEGCAASHCTPSTDPSPGAWCGARLRLRGSFSPGREDGWWPPCHSVLPPGLLLRPRRLRGSPVSETQELRCRLPCGGGLGSRGSRFIWETFPCISFPGAPASRPAQHQLWSCFGDSGPYFQRRVAGDKFLFVIFKTKQRKQQPIKMTYFYSPRHVVSDLPPGIHNFPKPVNGRR